MDSYQIGNIIAEKLSSYPADEIFAECRSYLNQYYFSWALVLKISEFMYSRYTLSEDPEHLLHEILGYTERICGQCKDKSTVRCAGYIRICCLMQLGKSDAAEEKAVY